MTSNEPTGIVWLASYPKSGNTWVRSFLNNLHAVMEHGLDVEPQNLNDMQKLTAWDIGAAQYQTFLDKPIKDCTAAEIDAVRTKVQQAVTEHNTGVLLVKTHNALVMSNGHPTINFAVTAGAVYIVRNPLDVAISFSHHIGQSIDEAIRVMSTPGHRPRDSEKLSAKSTEAGVKMSRVGPSRNIPQCWCYDMKICMPIQRKLLGRWLTIFANFRPIKSCKGQLN